MALVTNMRYECTIPPVSIWSHLHRFYWQLKARPKYGCKMFFSSCTSLTISVALLPPFEENTLAQAGLVSMSCTSRYSGRSLTHRQTMTWQSPLQLTRRQIKAFIFPRTSGRESCDDKFHQFLIGSYATQLLGPFHQCGEQATITPWVLKSTTKFLKLELGWHLIAFKSNETQPWSLVTNWLTSV